MYIKQQVARNPDFVIPMAMQTIVNHMNKKYGDYGPAFFSRTFLMQYHKEKVSKNKTMGTPPTIQMVFLNVTRLHIEVLQLSN